MLSENQRRWKERFDRAKDEVLERDRQREADRLASLANPPKYDGSRCQTSLFAFQENKVCPLGTPGCVLNHNATDVIPAEVLEARIAANKAARKRDGEHLQD